MGPRTISHKRLAEGVAECRLCVTHVTRSAKRCAVVLVVPAASAATQVLLIHAPYPGHLRFPGLPTSLLHAAAPLVRSFASRGALATVGLLDPGDSSEAFYADLEALLQSAPIRVIGISTSTAAIEETARIVALVRGILGEGPVVVVGGPHEDDVEEKVASRIAGVDVSVAGDGSFVLRELVEEFLEASDTRPEEVVRGLPQRLRGASDRRGQFLVTSRWLERGAETFDFGPTGVGELAERPLLDRRVRFSVFKARETVPLLVSRGCSYGGCSFCAEGGGRATRAVIREFDFLRDLVCVRPDAALYFQDSIFPATSASQRELLPLLRDLKVEWGAQVYLGTLSKPWVEELARHGCRYLYTGLESTSVAVLSAVGKRALLPSQALERLRWVSDTGMSVGVSLMFGAMAIDGTLVETTESVSETVRFAEQVMEAGVRVAGFYPNVETVLPGTALARGLARAGHELDFYRMPRTDAFKALEDGGVGFNFATMPGAGRGSDGLAERIAVAAARVTNLSLRAPSQIRGTAANW